MDTTNASTVAIVGNGTFFSWNINSGKQLISVPLKNPLTTDDGLYALSSNGTRLVGCSWGRGTIWNAQSGQVLQSWPTKGKAVFISRNGRALVYDSGDIYLFVDSLTGKVLWQKQRKGGYSIFPYLTEDDEVFFSTSRRCEVFDLFTGHLKRQLARPHQSDGEVLRLTSNWIYTQNPRGEILRWRAR